MIKFRHHGDVLLTTPVFNTIKNHYPHIQMDALVYSETAPMLEGLPSLSELHCVDRQWKKQGFKFQVQQELKLISTLKERKYDLVIHLTEHWRGATLCRLLKPRYSIVAKYPNRQNKFWKNSFTHHYPRPHTLRHTVEKHLDALRHLNLFPVVPSDTKTSLAVSDSTMEEVNHLLQQHGVAEDKYILFHPTSRWLFKCWKETYAAELIDQLDDAGWTILLTSGPDGKEQDMIARIKALCKSTPVDLSGKTTLKQLGGFIGKSRLFVGMDSVPMHIAAALQKPTVALFGPSGDKEWGPWQTESEVLVDDISCRPCGLDGCGGSKVSNCLYAITPERTMLAIQRVLARTEPSEPISLDHNLC